MTAVRVADTSALYAFFDEGDAFHAQALRAFEDPETIWVPAEVLAELLQLMARRVGRETVQGAGEFLWHMEHTEIQPSDTAVLMAAWGHFEAAKGKLSYVDAIVAATCEELDAEPLTFDRDILRALRR